VIFFIILDQQVI